MGVWTDRSRAIIREVFERLPVGATEAQARKALSGAYDFGERAMHPYKVWCREVKEALAKRYAGRAAPGAPARPSFLLRWRGERPWLEVECPWRQAHPPTAAACLACGPLHDRLRLAVTDPEFQALVRGVDAGDPFLAPLLDWLYERGVEAAPPEAPEVKRAARPRRVAHAAFLARFLDGPAAGVRLRLARRPALLRATRGPEGWDALDLLDDAPGPAEAVFAYRLVSSGGHARVDFTDGNGRRRGTNVRLADYALCDRQPDDAAARDLVAWRAWCVAEAARMKGAMS